MRKVTLNIEDSLHQALRQKAVDTKQSMSELVNNRITKIKEVCRKYNVLSVHLFGSVLTKEFNERSDIDLLVDLRRDSFHGAFDQFMNFKADMEDLFQRRVDLISRSTIRNQILKSEIDSSKVQIYAA